MANRVTYRRRLSYNTASNATRVSKTPGGRLTVLYRKKMGKVPTCGDTGVKLSGVCFTLFLFMNAHVVCCRSPASARSSTRSFLSARRL